MEQLAHKYPDKVRLTKQGSYDIIVDKNSVVNVKDDGITYDLKKKFRERQDYIDTVRLEKFPANRSGFARWLLSEFCNCPYDIDEQDQDSIEQYIKKNIKPKRLRELKIVTYGKMHRDTVEGTEEVFGASVINAGLDQGDKQGTDDDIQVQVKGDPKFRDLIVEIVTLTEVNEYKTIGIYSYQGASRAVAVAEILKKIYYPRAVIQHLDLDHSLSEGNKKGSQKLRKGGSQKMSRGGSQKMSRGGSQKMSRLSKKHKGPYCVVTVKPQDQDEPVNIEFKNPEGNYNYKFRYDERVGWGLDGGYLNEIPTYFFVEGSDGVVEVSNDNEIVIKHLANRKLERTVSDTTVRMFGAFVPNKEI